MNESIATVLSWMNDLRAAYDQPPLDEMPCGEQNSTRRCPIARGLVGVDGIKGVGAKSLIVSTEQQADELADLIGLGRDDEFENPGEDEYRVMMIDEARSFVADFDGGRLPELTESPEGEFAEKD